MSDDRPITHRADPPKATRREWVGFAVLALPATLLETARAAFTEAVVLAAMVSAALAIVAAIVTATMLRAAGSQSSSAS